MGSLVCAVTSVKVVGCPDAEADATGAGEHQVGFEVVIEIDLKDGLGSWGDALCAPWEGKRWATGEIDGFCVGCGDDGGLFVIEGERADPVPLPTWG